jgi:hypothetical protein
MDFIDIGLIGSYILIGLCTLAATLIPLYQSFGDPKTLLKSGIGIGIMMVVFLFGYLLADGSSGVDEATSKFVGAGIITTYAFFFLAIAGIIYTEVSKIFS